MNIQSIKTSHPVSILFIIMAMTIKPDCIKITGENVTDFVKSFDTVLTDCDGVLWHDNDILKGSPDTVQMFKKMGKKIVYLTNNSTKSREMYEHKCTSLGFPATKNDIVGTAFVAAQYVKNDLQYTGKVFIVGSVGLKEEFKSAGIPFLTKDDYKDQKMDTPTDIVAVKLDPEVKCVVVGFDITFDFRALSLATCYLNQPGCHFVSTNEDSALPMGNGMVVPGTGSILAAVKTASHREPDVVCGKPHNTIFSEIPHTIDPQKTIMIGDRLNTDIALGHNCGPRTLLVLTGFSKLEDAQERIKSGDRWHEVPNYYVDSLGQLGDIMKEKFGDDVSR